MERDEEHLFPSDETLLSQAERMRRGMKRLGKTALTPTEEEIAKTISPDQMIIEGLDIEPEKPVEKGWKKKQ